jgi:hypothetical protein
MSDNARDSLRDYLTRKILALTSRLRNWQIWVVCYTLGPDGKGSFLTVSGRREFYVRLEAPIISTVLLMYLYVSTFPWVKEFNEAQDELRLSNATVTRGSSPTVMSPLCSPGVTSPSPIDLWTIRSRYLGLCFLGSRAGGTHRWVSPLIPLDNTPLFLQKPFLGYYLCI